MQTGTERLIWAQGSPSTLRAVVTTVRGIKLTIAAAICWENYMPLLRQALYSQNVNLYLAPTADARDTWVPLMQTIALEGRCFVLSANQCVQEKDLPEWIRQGSKVGSSGAVEGAHGRDSAEETSQASNGEEAAVDLSHGERLVNAPTSGVRPRHKSIVVAEGSHKLFLPIKSNDDPTPSASSTAQTSSFVSRGGSTLVHPTGAVLSGPLWEDSGNSDEGSEDYGMGTLLIQTVDMEDCLRGRLDFDAAGSYSRNDAFRLEVEGLELDPPE